MVEPAVLLRDTPVVAGATARNWTALLSTLKVVGVKSIVDVVMGGPPDERME
jgi:hypothetical protein